MSAVFTRYHAQIDALRSELVPLRALADAVRRLHHPHFDQPDTCACGSDLTDCDTHRVLGLMLCDQERCER